MDLHGLCSSPCGKAVHGKSVHEGCALLPLEGRLCALWLARSAAPWQNCLNSEEASPEFAGTASIGRKSLYCFWHKAGKKEVCLLCISYK
jgi:hypothetical protein